MSELKRSGNILWVFGLLVAASTAIGAVNYIGPVDPPKTLLDLRMEALEEQYLAGEIDESDPVVQARQWRSSKPVFVKILGNPVYSNWEDPQFTPWYLPIPKPERTPALTIPPEIMAQWDPEILANREPTYATLKQDMIFDLRSAPHFDADFVRFDFELDELSKPQLEILGNWARCGHNSIMLMGEEIGKFADFLGGQRAFFHTDLDREPKPLVLACDHVTATDCARVAVPFDWRELLVSRDFYWEGLTPTKTPGIEVFAYYLDRDNMRVFTEEEEENETERDKWVAAYGRFMNGNTAVYFRPFYRANGPDGDRFELNWTHWILCHNVPGPACTDVACLDGPTLPCQPAAPCAPAPAPAPCGHPSPCGQSGPCGQVEAPSPIYQPAIMVDPAIEMTAPQPVIDEPGVLYVQPEDTSTLPDFGDSLDQYPTDM
ncbi:MAG: hypothetical protein ACYTFO_10645, partial [Planctomycetota bacterium]|jgi:hypothetical protein